MEKFKNKIIEELKSKTDLQSTFRVLLNDITKFESVYYKEIIAIESVFRNFQNGIALGTISGANQSNLAIFFSAKRKKIAKNILDEQEKSSEENYKFAKEHLNKIHLLVREEKMDEIIVIFNKIFSRTHSKHYPEFLRLISKKYNPTLEDYDEFENRIRYKFLTLRRDVLFEKELIQNKNLVNGIYKSEEFKTQVALLSKGKIAQCLRSLENQFIKRYYLFDNEHYEEKDDYTIKFNYFFRKASRLMYDLLSLEKDKRYGLIENKNYYLTKLSIVEETLLLMEKIFRDNIIEILDTKKKE